MKAHQFIRSANCYYKLQGEILLNIQFACYDTPARICFCAQPYWVLDGWIGNDRPNVHNHWCWFDGDIADVLAVLDPVSVEQNTYNRFDRASVERFFEQLGERFQKYLFPALERMTDFENYFREVSAFHPNGTMIPSVVLRYCAIKDGDYQRFLRYREQYEACLNAFRNSASGKMSPEQIEAEATRALVAWKQKYAQLLEAVESGRSPECFREEHDALCEKMQDTLWKWEHLTVGKYDSKAWREMLKPVKLSVRLKRNSSRSFWSMASPD